jgi:hypothetical protein
MNRRMLACEIVNAYVIDLEVNLAGRCQSSVDQIFYHFGLRVDCDPFSGEFLEVDTVTAPIESQLDAVVHQTFALHSIANASLCQQVNRMLFQNSGTDTFLNVLAAAAFKNDGIDAAQVEQVRQH